MKGVYLAGLERGLALCRRWMRGSPPNVAPLGLSHCLPALVFGTDGPERIASIGLDLTKGGHPLVSPSIFLTRVPYMCWCNASRC